MILSKTGRHLRSQLITLVLELIRRIILSLGIKVMTRTGKRRAELMGRVSRGKT